MKNLNTEHQTNKRNSFSPNEIQGITIEKRKRYQKYSLLNFCTSLTTYFDYFSLDTFNIIKNAKYLATSSNSNTITNSHVLLSFLEKNKKLCAILEDIGIKKADIFMSLNTPKKSYYVSFIEQLFLKLQLFFLKDNMHDFSSVIFSEETQVLFEKAAENALLHFKTPVITSEILFLTLVEQKSTSIGNYLQKIYLKKTFWHSLRYRLLKHIHFIETFIRNNVPKNQHYFAYLLQTQIPETHFERLINNGMLEWGVLFFRAKLLSKLQKFSLSSIIEKEIYKSIKFSDRRKYTL